MKKSFIVVLLTLLAACGKQAETPSSGTGPAASRTGEAKPVPVERKQDFASVTRGGKLFQQHCADCHGSQAEGAPNWRKLDANGKYPPPPLNGTGHAWHHSVSVLKMTIRDGTAKLGGSMPPWGDKLSEQDITDLVNWIQSRWPDEIYATWYRNQRQ